MWDIALPLTAAVSGVAWAQLAAWRAGERTGQLALRSLLGGAAAFGLALVAYDLAAGAGFHVRWERLTRADTAALLVACAAAAFEEAAKLAGILLVLEARVRTRTALAAAFGVAAGFSALEALLVLQGDHSAIALVRAAFAPVAHALIAVPLAYGAAEWLRRRSFRPLLQGLLASVTIHAAGNLCLAIPWIGHAGYALTLAAPALVLFVRSRRHLRANAPALSPARRPQMERVRSIGGP